MTSTRWVLCAVWGLGILTAVIDARLGRASVASPVAFATLLGALWAISTPGADVLSRGRALLVVMGVLATVTMVAATGPATGRTWLVDLSGYVIALLVARGNLGAGALALVGYTAIVASWVAQSPPPPPFVAVLGAPAFALVGGVVWFVVLRRAVARERAHRSDAARAETDARIAVEAAHADQREIAAIRAVVEPILRRLLAGDSLDDAARLDAGVAEATVRDRIRSPWEPGNEFDARVERLRRQGVIVVQIGERSGRRVPMPAPLVVTLLEILAPVSTGRVTVRTLPPGRGAAMTVVIDDGATVSRTSVTADGALAERDSGVHSGQTSGT